ncbi:MAG: hypothetical protein EPN26_09885 [Rhodospirillales bacterium]|nr:MAG: hypothetical protein EPN26_09885 [Rhodospirillales bacterium]
MRAWRFWGLLFLLSAFTQPVLAEPFEFTSRTYGGFPQLLRGEVQAEVTLKAILEIPPGPGPHAALVVAHSCAGWGGIGHGEKMILDAAREAGYATLIHDSFGPRGWKNVCSGEAGTAGNPSVIADAFAALEALSKDPRIKKDAIFIAGASMGGMTAWFAALEPLRQRLVTGGARFAGHSAFYPAGGNGFIADKVFTGGPVVVMFGLDDDWTPPKRVRLMMERQMAFAKEPQPEIRFVDYAGARHGWLNVQMQDVKFLPKASSQLNCPLIFTGQGAAFSRLIWADGREMDVAPTDVRKYMADCAIPGVTMQGHVDVTRKSLDEMIALMNRVDRK